MNTPINSPTAEVAANQLRERADIDSVDAAIVVGSGWAAACTGIGTEILNVRASDIEGFADSTVPGHSGSLRIIELANRRRVLQIGSRTHLYEGRGTEAVIHGVRTAAALGATSIILTNGAGSTSRDYQPGDVVVITDHINMTARSPITGATFVDMTDAYSPAFQAVAHEIAPDLKTGVYCQLPGPHYETAAEIRMLAALGANVVGMSTALETIEARRLGLDVLGLTLVTNLGAGLQAALNHEEVVATGAASAPRLAELLTALLPRIADAA